MSKHAIRNTILATITLLVFIFSQGAVVMVCGLEGTAAILTQAFIIWCCALVAILFYLIKYHGLKELGFVKPMTGYGRRFLYFIPLLIVAIVSFAGGLISGNGGMIVLNLFFTLGIGFAEEIYFRGIICGIWKDKEKTAVIISSVLFGFCHLLNIMGGASVAATLLQILFAFVYGIVMAIIFLRTKSIWPCIFLHAFHDFCGFITAEGDMKLTVIIGSIQFVVLLVYCIYLASGHNKK